VRICAVIKYPPIQGGVSAQSYWLARGLAARGHRVDVVTNALEVEENFRIRLTPADAGWLEPRFDHGGGVHLHTPELYSAKLIHIPQSNPFVSRLAGLVTDVVREQRSDVIFGYYLEPNGVAAHLASSWTGRPYVVQHAGSDLGRLMKQPGLDVTYREVFRRAHGVVSGSLYTFLGMGVAAESLYKNAPFHLPADFSPAAAPLDIATLATEIGAESPAAVHHPGPLDPAAPTIGAYGKIGEAKGSYDLLAVLGRLRRQGRRFNFVAATSGREIERYRAAVAEHELLESTWLLPFMAHWRVPGFLRACDAVCFLERDFPIAFHAPTIPREVLSCGTCLILSGEILAKQPYRHRLVDGENVLLVQDPKDHDALARALAHVLNDPAAAREIGRRGAEVLPDVSDHDAHAAAYERIFEDVIARHAGQPSVMSAADRGLAIDRVGTLRRLAAPLVDALGDGADAALAAHIASDPVDDQTGGAATPHADARALCVAWRERPAVSEEAHRIRDAARYAELLIWMGSFDAPDGTDIDSPRFHGLDVLPERGGGSWAPAVVQTLAPRMSNWVRIARFDHLPASGGDVNGERTVIFHKVPSLTGRHFGVNRFTASLLEGCDGRRSVTRLVDEYTTATGRAPAEVARTVIATLRRFYREGLIIFVDPQAAPAQSS